MYTLVHNGNRYIKYVSCVRGPPLRCGFLGSLHPTQPTRHYVTEWRGVRVCACESSRSGEWLFQQTNTFWFIASGDVRCASLSAWWTRVHKAHACVCCVSCMGAYVVCLCMRETRAMHPLFMIRYAGLTHHWFAELKCSSVWMRYVVRWAILFARVAAAETDHFPNWGEHARYIWSMLLSDVCYYIIWMDAATVFVKTSFVVVAFVVWMVRANVWSIRLFACWCVRILCLWDFRVECSSFGCGVCRLNVMRVGPVLMMCALCVNWMERIRNSGTWCGILCKRNMMDGYSCNTFSMVTSGLIFPKSHAFCMPFCCLPAVRKCFRQMDVNICSEIIPT